MVTFNRIKASLTDASGTTKMFNGSIIYMFANDINYGFTNNVGYNPLVGASPHVDTSNDSGVVGSMWNRRKNFTSQGAMENPIINLQGTFSDDHISVGSVGNDVVLTPHRLLRIATSGSTWWLNEEFLVQSFLDGSDGESFYPNGSGIPVVVSSFNIKRGRTQENALGWTINFREDKTDFQF